MAHTLSRRWILATVAVWTLGGSAHAADLRSARTALTQGQHDAASVALHAILQAEPRNPDAHLLLCRVELAAGNPDTAASECEAALENGFDHQSEAQDWAGRAYGAKAAKSSMLTAFSLARKVRTAFESAVALDTSSSAAIDDLSDFYIQAPAIVGGGMEKAAALADRSADSNPAAAHRTRALLAQKHGDNAAAEREFRAAVAVAHQPAAIFDLANFLSLTGRPDAAVDLAKSAAAADKPRSAVSVDAARLLLGLHPDAAEPVIWLKEYLASPARSDAEPAYRVEVLLGNLLVKAGRGQEARNAYTAALQMYANDTAAKQALSRLPRGGA